MQKPVSEVDSRRARRQSRARSAAPADAQVIDALWLDTLQRICARAAHEIKGALNGVSVNLEVVRARAERPDAQASAVEPYAATAAEQLAAVISMTEAVLTLARPAREPLEIGPFVRRLDALLAPFARADGRRLEIAEAMETAGRSTAPANAVRLAVAAALLDALEQSASVTCRPMPASFGADAAAPTGRLCIESADGSRLTIRQDIAAAVGAAGIRMTTEHAGLTITFPCAGDDERRLETS